MRREINKEVQARTKQRGCRSLDKGYLIWPQVREGFLEEVALGGSMGDIHIENPCPQHICKSLCLPPSKQQITH